MARRKLEAALEASRILSETQCDGQFNIQAIYQYEDYRGGLYSLEFSQNNLLVAGYGDGGFEAFRVNQESLELFDVGKPGMHGGLPITTTRVHPTNPNIVLASSADGRIWLWSIGSGKAELVAEEAHNEINAMDIDCNGTSFATAGKDLCVRIYDMETAQCTHKFQGFNPYNYIDQVSDCHACRVFSLRYNPEKHTEFITGGWDNHLKIWDSRFDEPVTTMISGPHVCGDGIDIRKDHILTASWVKQSALQLWSYSYRKLVQTLPFEVGGDSKGEYLYSCRFSTDNRVVAGGSGTSNVQAFTLDNNQIIGKIAGKTRGINCIDVNDDGTLLAFGGNGQQLCVATLL